jgi:phage replication O-like protein O
MKNPWKQYSKINPQRENGNRQIANDVFCALMATDLTGAELRIVMAVINKTWGFDKESDCIATSQFMEMTGLAERTVKKTIKTLKDKKIICYKPSRIRVHHGSPLNEFIFNKHYDTWNAQGCTTLHACTKVSSKGARKGKTRVHAGSPTKETITKETITKEKRLFVATSIELQLAELLLKKIISRNPNFKRPDLQKWSLDIDRTIRIDKRDPETIRAVIEWCQEDDFWQNNILSTSKLRKQFDQLIMKMNSRETRVLSPKGRKTAERLERWMAQ